MLKLKFANFFAFHNGLSYNQLGMSKTPQKSSTFVIFLALIFCFPGKTVAEQVVPKRVDFDSDGSKESLVSYEGKKISKVVMDKNHDGKTDAVIYYRQGFRDHAEIDGNFDGKIDTVILYYFTGVPAMISLDRNADNRPERWTFFKNGIIYKREWDRNFDGMPDYRILFSTKADLRMEKKHMTQSIVKQYDDDFDGVFEKSVKAEKRTNPKRLSVLVGSLSEENL